MNQQQATQKGRKSENKIADALEELKQSGEITTFKRTKNLGKADMKGVDYWITCGDNRIPLQVKSSWYYYNEHLKSQNGHIPCIVAQGCINKMKGLIRNMILKWIVKMEGYVSGNPAG